MAFDLPLKHPSTKKIKGPIVPTSAPTPVPRPRPTSAFGSEEEKGLFSSVGQNPLLPLSLGGGSMFNDPATREFGGELLDAGFGALKKTINFYDATSEANAQAQAVRALSEPTIYDRLGVGGGTWAIQATDPEHPAFETTYAKLLRGELTKENTQSAFLEDFNKRPLWQQITLGAANPVELATPLLGGLIPLPTSYLGKQLGKQLGKIGLRTPAKLIPSAPQLKRPFVTSADFRPGPYEFPDEIPMLIGNNTIDNADIHRTILRSEKLDEVYGVGSIEIGLSRTEEISSALKKTWIKTKIPVIAPRGLPDIPDWAFGFRMAPENKYATPAMKFQANAQNKIDSVANTTGRRVSALLNQTFKVDEKGRIQELAGIDENIPFAPTIQDVAARLPIYRETLEEINPEGLKALNRVKAILAPIGEVADDVGMEVGVRSDVMEGGFYIHRGSPVLEGPRRFMVAMHNQSRGKPAFAKAERWDSMDRSIEGVANELGEVERWKYPVIREAVTAYVREMGQEGVSRTVGNYFKSLIDPITGKPLAIQSRELVPTVIKARHSNLQSSLSNARNTVRNNLLRVPILRREGEALSDFAAREVRRAEVAAKQGAQRVARTEEEILLERWQAIGTSDLKEINKEFLDSIELGRTLAVRLALDAQELKLVKGLMSNNDIKLVEELRQLENAISGAENYLKSNLFAEQSRLSPAEYFAGVNRIVEIDERAERLMAKSERLSRDVDEYIGKGTINSEAAEDVRASMIDSRRIARTTISRDLRVGKLERQLKVLQREQKTLDRIGDRAREGAAKQGVRLTAKQLELEGRATASRASVEKFQGQLNDLSGEWHKALQISKAPTKSQIIPISGMYGHFFPDEIANAARSYLAESGAVKVAGPVVSALNTMYRGFRSTGEASGSFIQASLGLAQNPAIWAKAMEVSFRAWGWNPGVRGERAIDLFISNFSDSREALGRLTAELWSTGGLRINGADTEFTLGQGLLESFGRLPLVRNANRAFGAIGDAMRLEWADDMLEEQLNLGRSLDEIWASGDIQRIAKSVNGATGWTEKRFAGSLGDLVIFAPRFFAARIETSLRAIGAIAQDPRIIAEVVPFSPIKATRAPLDQRIAARSLLRLVGYGIALTEGINRMQGRDTDYMPVKQIANGDWVRNSDFITFRAFGRDYSVFGTYDSLVGLFVTMGAKAYSGKGIEKAYGPHEAMRSMASGVVSNAVDFISGSNAIGGRVRDSGEQTRKRIFENFTPFTYGDAPEIRTEFLREREKGGPVGATVGAVVGGLSEFLGVKSSPRSASEFYTETALEVADKLNKRGGFQQDVNGVNLSREELLDIEDKITDRDWFNLPKSVRDKVDENPIVSSAKEARDKRARELSNPSQLYFDAIDVVDKVSDEKISRLAFEHGWTPEDPTKGSGKEFRLQYGLQMMDRAEEMEDEREAHAEVLESFDRPLDEDAALETAARKAYIEQLFDPKLENQITNEYNYRERKSREVTLRGEFGDPMIDRIEAHYRDRENEHPLVTILRDDRETLEPYWEIPERLPNELNARGFDWEELGLPPGVAGADLWIDYLDQSSKDKKITKLMLPEFITSMERIVAAMRTAYRTTDPSIDEALIRQGYSDAPTTPAGVQEFIGSIDSSKFIDLISGATP